MTQEKIARINELAHKSKTTGLTDAERPSSRPCGRSIWPMSRPACAPSWTARPSRSRTAPSTR